LFDKTKLGRLAMLRFRASGISLLVLVAIALSGCGPRFSDLGASGSATENPAIRSAMLVHAQAVWPVVRHGLTGPVAIDELSTATAEASTMGTAQAVWAYYTSRIATAGSSPWTGIGPQTDRHLYYIPVLVSGSPVAGLATDDMGGWHVWPEQNYAAMEASAALLLDRYFASSSFEWRYVQDGGVWVIARSGAKVAGVLIEPWGEELRNGTPAGVVAEDQLRWWLAHPMGR
jgi:hypothetical protein